MKKREKKQWNRKQTFVVREKVRAFFYVSACSLLSIFLFIIFLLKMFDPAKPAKVHDRICNYTVAFRLKKRIDNAKKRPEKKCNLRVTFLSCYMFVHANFMPGEWNCDDTYDFYSKHLFTLNIILNELNGTDKRQFTCSLFSLYLAGIHFILRFPTPAHTQLSHSLFFFHNSLK